MSLELIIIAIVVAAASGWPGLCLGRASVWSERIAAAMMSAAAVVGLAGVVAGICSDARESSGFPWPAAGNSAIGVDALSAFFLVPVFVIGALGAIYGLGYWPQRLHPGSGRKLRLFWGTLVAAMAVLVVARHAMAFLLGWEMMALSAFFLVGTEDEREECRRAAWLYLVATHVGTLALFALFAAWRHATGSYALQPVASDALGLAQMNTLFLLALVAFGLKAGVMPLHFWLPGAHANAPTHVSAILSGVVLKMGVYGLLRFLSLFPDPPAAWGGMILTLGMISCLLGVAFAIGQHDLKRLLAYHSVENIGIILIGLGLAMLGRSAERPEWIVLGLAGCLLHVWNHGLFKSLLFLAAGSVVHATHTREIDHLGGLSEAMPWTATMFLVGAVAICGLPPLNGFVSELLVYLGLLGTLATHGGSGSAAAVAAPVLAMAGALALACFVKVYGAVFLGSARTEACERAREAPATMKGPMLFLALCCALIGTVPVVVGPLLDRVVATWMSSGYRAHPELSSLVPLRAVTALSLSFVALVVVIALMLERRGRAPSRSVTWDCGYAAPTSRMQYSASSFAQMIVRMFRGIVRPRIHDPAIEGVFPLRGEMHSHIDDAVLDRLLLPAGRAVREWFGMLRGFQQGLAQHYVLYILITVLVMLSMQIPIARVVTRMFER
ncbi:MAG: hydrogenase [Deltaproteobacteria bacterium]|nr:hydrogenase [Deltaproteobacteria bacterium]